ncbi:metallophosphoesterase [Verrucomicrobiales bacterium]|nr:metallophosphoesterase [Verrucomicrobiales bacterium]
MLKLGLVADCQYALGVAPYLDRYPAESLSKLGQAIDHFRSDREIQAVLNLGDLIDEGAAHFAAPLELFGKLEVPIFHALGNHDFDVSEYAKTNVAEILGLAGRYYTTPLPESGWRLVVLDGTTESTFGHPRKSDAWHRAVEVWERMEPRPEEWNGGLGEAQLAWLEETLAAARKTGERVIVACHWPLLPEGSRFLLWDAGEVRQILVRYADIVAAYLCGHHHEGGISKIYGHAEVDIPHLNLVGMVDTHENAYAVATFSEQGLFLEGFGRQASSSLLG